MSEAEPDWMIVALNVDEIDRTLRDMKKALRVESVIDAKAAANKIKVALDELRGELWREIES